MSFLADILESTRVDIETHRRERPLQAIQANLPSRPDERRLAQALRKPDVSVIAEFKRSSPSKGRLHSDPDLRKIVRAYERGGASALSVLTERHAFEGSLEDLRSAREACALPILRKDFIIDEYQVYEAAEAGADAILLIVAALKQPGHLQELHDLARHLNLDVLVEVRSRDELDEALAVSADLIGINNRNLDTFEVDVETTLRLIKEIPKTVTVVSESGLKSREDLDKLAASGVKAALIGSALMNADDPEAKCRELTRTVVRTPGTSSSSQPAYA